MMFDIVDLAPALKFTAVRENEPAKHLSDIMATYFASFKKIAAGTKHNDHLLRHSMRIEIQQHLKIPWRAFPCFHQVCTLLSKRKTVQQQWLPGKGSANFSFRASAFHHWTRDKLLTMSITVSAMTAQTMAILAHSAV